MTKLIIAEKASVAREIAAAVGATGKEDGCLCGDGWAVAWAAGHLVDLAVPQDYEGWDGDWQDVELPMLPKEWKWKVSRDAKKRFDALSALIESGRFDEVVNACDPDREGEGIFTRIYAQAGGRLPVTRLWSSSLEPAAIRADLDARKPAFEKAGLAAASEGRAKADWLVGMNATRAATLAAGETVNLGRVQTPTLAIVVKRTDEAENFTVKTFWRAVTDMGGWKLEGPKRDEQAQAERDAEAARAGLAVKEAKCAEKSVKPPLPFNLNDLQAASSRVLGMSAAETLDALEELYLAKLVSYPRTESRHIGSADVAACEKAVAAAARMPQLAEAAAEAGCDPAAVARVADDSKVVGHAALAPLAAAFDPDKTSGLQERQKGLLLLVAGRLLACACAPCVTRNAKVVAQAGGVEFEASSSSPVREGFKAVERAARAACGKKPAAAEKPQDIPGGLERGQALSPASVETAEGKTKPPSLFTDATLLRAMETCGKDVEDKALRDALSKSETHAAGLGTPATRASIIERLVTRGFCERVKKTRIRATDRGRRVIARAPKGLTSPELTGQMEEKLARIEGASAMEALDMLNRFLKEMEEYTMEIMEEIEDNAQKTVEEESPGACPICGNPVARKNWGWECSTNKTKKVNGRYKLMEGCGFKLFKEKSGHELSEDEVKTLLSGGTTQAVQMKSRRGSAFKARMKLEDDEQGGKAVKFVFDADEEAGKCPRCGQPVVKRGSVWKCSSNRSEKTDDGWKDVAGCGFKLGKQVHGHPWEADEVKKLLEDGEVFVKGMTGKNGKAYDAFVVLDKESDWGTSLDFRD